MISVPYKTRIKELNPQERKIIQEYFVAKKTKKKIQEELKLTEHYLNLLIISSYEKLLSGSEINTEPHKEGFYSPKEKREFQSDLIQKYKDNKFRVFRITSRTKFYDLPPGELSIRTLNAIVNAKGYDVTIAEVSKIPASEMRKWKNMGPKSVLELQDWLRNFKSK